MSDIINSTKEINPYIWLYKKSYVAFLDILGFSEYIDSSKEDVFKQNNALAMLQIPQKTKQKFVKTTIMSDSIILSIPIENENAFESLLEAIILQQMMISVKFCLRGAITVGDIYQSEETVFGPAMIEAHKLESEKAIFPRVIVTEDILEEIVKIDKSNGIIADQFFKLDEDKQVFFDILSFSKASEWDTLLLGLWRKSLIQYLRAEKTSDNRVKEKYEWLAKYIFIWRLQKQLGEDAKTENPLDYFNVILQQEEGTSLQNSKVILKEKIVCYNTESKVLVDENNELPSYDNTEMTETKFLQTILWDMSNVSDWNFFSIHIFNIPHRKRSVFEISYYIAIEINDKAKIKSEKYIWKELDELKQIDKKMIKDIFKTVRPIN